MSIKALRRLRRAWLPVRKKSILVMFVVILAIALAFVWVWAKDTDQSKQTGKATAIQPTEPNKVTPELIQVRPKAKMMTDLSQIPEGKKNLGKVTDEGGPVIARKPMDYCEVQMFDAANLFRFTNRYIYYPYLPDAFLTLQDPMTPFAGPCPAPQFPFKVTDVSMSYRTFGATGGRMTGWVHGVIYDADMANPDCPKPGALRARTADIYINDPANYSFNYLFNVPLLDGICRFNGPYFAGFVWDSTADITSVDGWSPKFNTAGTTCFDYEDYGDGWYDFGAYAGVGPTAFWSSGYVKDQNDCPPDTIWFFKAAYLDAPCGLPDFEQYDHGFPNNGDAYCGPTAKANCLWWMWARDAGKPPEEVHVPRFWGPGGFDWPNLAMQIAALAQTDPITGTECDKLFAADEKLRTQIPLWVTEQNVVSPDFAKLDDELRACEDVILLLGFWYEDPPASGIWKRFGGHFVTMTGVNTGFSMMAISDPAFDNAEMGGFGFVCHLDPWPQPGNPLVHDNPANVSKDAFMVAPSPSPGGIIGLQDYWVGRESQMLKFQGQNFRTVHLPNQGPVPPPGTPVFTEIEQAIVVSPVSREMSGEVLGSESREIDNNYGGVDGFAIKFGEGWFSSLFKGSFLFGQTENDLAFDWGASLRKFLPEYPPRIGDFIVKGTIDDYKFSELSNEYAHPIIPDIKVLQESFAIWPPYIYLKMGNSRGTLTINIIIWGFRFPSLSSDSIPNWQTGMLFDYDIGSNNCDVDFDQQHQSMWMWDVSAPDTVFGLTKIPAIVGDRAITGWGLSNPTRIYDGQYLDSLKYWMENLGWGVDNPGVFEDKSILMADNSFELPGDISLGIWFKWGYLGPIGSGGDTNWRRFLYGALHQQGYYRGDVNKDGKLNVTDVIYLVNYLFKGGPKPIEFVDQGNVNNDANTNVADVIYIVNYLFKGGPAPIDNNRFLADPNNFVDPTHRSLGVRIPGLFGDPDWKGLGQ